MVVCQKTIKTEQQQLADPAMPYNRIRLVGNMSSKVAPLSVPNLPLETGQSDLLQSALENVPCVTCIFDGDLRLVKCNAMYLDLLKFPPEFSNPGTPIPAFSGSIR